MKKFTKIIVIILLFVGILLSANLINVSAKNTSVNFRNFQELQGTMKLTNVNVTYKVNQNEGTTSPNNKKVSSNYYLQLHSLNSLDFELELLNNYKINSFVIFYNGRETNIEVKNDIKIYGSNDKNNYNEITNLIFTSGKIEVNNILYNSFRIVNVSENINPNDVFELIRIQLFLNDGNPVTDFTELYTKSSLNITYTRNLDNTFNISRVDLRFGARIDKSLYDALIKENITEFGIEITNLEPNISKYYKCNPVVVNEKGMEDENGKFVQFAVVITNIPFENYQTELSGNCCIVDNGTKKYMRNKIASVSTVAKLYIEATDTSSYKEHLDVLTYLSKGGK